MAGGTGGLNGLSAMANFFAVGALAAQVRVVEWDEDERRFNGRFFAFTLRFWQTCLCRTLTTPT